MKGTFSFIRDGRWLTMTLAVIAGVLLVVGGVQAATTISTNVVTGGTLSVTGASTLTGLTSMIQASSTRFSVHDTAYFGGSATTTIDSAGNVTVIGTLGVTGLTTLVNASSTRTSQTGNFMVNGFATTTAASGNIETEGDVTIGGGDLTVTTTNAATSTLIVGCVQMYATSTATAVHLEFNTTNSTSTINGASSGLVAWLYGACPI